MSEISTNDLVTKIVESIEDVKGENITILDLREIDNAFTKYFIICEGSSNTQVSAIARNIEKKVSKELKTKPFGVEGTTQGQWVLMDYIDVVVHIFLKNVREEYALEELWGDAEVVSL